MLVRQIDKEDTSEKSRLFQRASKEKDVSCSSKRFLQVALPTPKLFAEVSTTSWSRGACEHPEFAAASQGLMLLYLLDPPHTALCSVHVSLTYSFLSVSLLEMSEVLRKSVKLTGTQLQVELGRKSGGRSGL